MVRDTKSEHQVDLATIVGLYFTASIADEEEGGGEEEDDIESKFILIPNKNENETTK
jgi:hypothetical protein